MIAVRKIEDFHHPTLKEVFKNDFKIGVALNLDQISDKEPQALALTEKHFNSIVPENILKWEAVNPAPDKYNFEPVDRFVAFGEKNNMQIIGHALVWHHQTPEWVFLDESQNLVDRETLLRRLREYISRVVGRYKGRIHGWDVVNEAIDDNGQMRKSKWLEIVGEDYIPMAFEYTRAVDPAAKLYYNDYSLYLPAKRDSVVRLMKDLQSKGIRIDGIGMQGHFGLDYPEKIEDIEASILAFAELGVAVMITELDVNVLPLPDNQRGADISLNFELQDGFNPYSDGLPDAMQKKLAERYAEFFRIFRKHRDKLSRVTIWGIRDCQSWLNHWPIRGRTNYPLLFNDEYQPKPAFNAIINIGQNKKSD